MYFFASIVYWFVSASVIQGVFEKHVFPAITTPTIFYNNTMSLCFERKFLLNKPILRLRRTNNTLPISSFEYLGLSDTPLWG
jgi:hypothetical protein